MEESNKSFFLSNWIDGDLEMSFLLQNGDQFRDLLKKAQHDNAELQKDLKEISNFKPVFKIK